MTVVRSRPSGSDATLRRAARLASTMRRYTSAAPSIIWIRGGSSGLKPCEARVPIAIGIDASSIERPPNSMSPTILGQTQLSHCRQIERFRSSNGKPAVDDHPPISHGIERSTSGKHFDHLVPGKRPKTDDQERNAEQSEPTGTLRSEIHPHGHKTESE